MPVTVMLKDLVQIEKTEALWPEGFKALVAALEANPDDRTVWGALADWCGEENEQVLERGFRYIAKRPEIGIGVTRYSSSSYWSFKKLSYGLSLKGSNHTLAALAGSLAQAIEAAILELS